MSSWGALLVSCVLLVGYFDISVWQAPLTFSLSLFTLL
jgi:hypothetical protein